MRSEQRAPRISPKNALHGATVAGVYMCTPWAFSAFLRDSGRPGTHDRTGSTYQQNGRFLRGHGNGCFCQNMVTENHPKIVFIFRANFAPRVFVRVAARGISKVAKVAKVVKVANPKVASLVAKQNNRNSHPQQRHNQTHSSSPPGSSSYLASIVARSSFESC